MRRKLSGLLLGLLLCLAASATALAAETHSVSVSADNLTPGYYMGAVWDGDTLLCLFGATVDSSGVLKQDVNIGDTSIQGNTVTVALSNSSTDSAKPVVLTKVPVKTGGTTPGGPSDPSNPSNPTDPSNPSNPSNPGTPSTPNPPSTGKYRVDLNASSHGSLSASASSAASGDTVTVWVSPDSGYELSDIYVTGTGGQSVRLSGSGGRYTFTMPAYAVTVTADFSRIPTSSTTQPAGNSGAAASTPSQPVTQSVPQAYASGQTFSDIPVSHWAAGEIAWAYQNGFMNGTGGGKFNPNGSVTYQQLWTVLERILAARSNMSSTSLQAVRNGIADAQNPTLPITREHMVLALHRCAFLMSGNLSTAGSLAGYADSARVSSSARNAMIWAVTNGIISGTSDGKLNPSGTVTRAQFAVFLYRFYQRV